MKTGTFTVSGRLYRWTTNPRPGVKIEVRPADLKDMSARRARYLLKRGKEEALKAGA